MAYDLNKRKSGFSLIETKTITVATQNVTFLGLDGDKQTLYRLYYRFRNSAALAANYRVQPNGNDPNASTFIAGLSTGTVTAGAAGLGVIAFQDAGQLAAGVAHFHVRSGTVRRLVTNIGQNNTAAIQLSVQDVVEWADSAANIISITIAGSQPSCIGVDSELSLFQAQTETSNLMTLTTGPFVVTTVKTANYSAATNEFVLVDPTGGPFTVTLPQATAATSGFPIAIKNDGSSSNAITVNASGGSTVESAASQIYFGALFEIEFISDGAGNWMQR